MSRASLNFAPIHNSQSPVFLSMGYQESDEMAIIRHDESGHDELFAFDKRSGFQMDILQTVAEYLKIRCL